MAATTVNGAGVAEPPVARFLAPVAAAECSIAGSADDRFEAALDLLLDGIEARCRFSSIAAVPNCRSETHLEDEPDVAEGSW